jgi:diguanylate cyclase (GGDEF)-like protein/PAS domain S-box-containing protein
MKITFVVRFAGKTGDFVLYRPAKRWLSEHKFLPDLFYRQNVNRFMDFHSIMKMNLLTLKFSGDSSHLEKQFQRRNFHDSLFQNRAALIIGLVFYSAFGILDMLLMPESKSATWLIRFAVVDPAIAAIFLFSFSGPFQKYANPLLTFGTVLAGGGIIWMIVIAPPSVSHAYYAGLLLVFIWSYTFARTTFLWASFANWVIVILYEIAAVWVCPTPFGVLVRNNFFFISANIMGMIACYSMEYQTRRNFFLTRQVESEREYINSINRELESKTAEYRIVNRMLGQEIADREKAENALRVSEEQYRTLVESASDIIFRTDIRGYITFINPAALRITGYMEKDILGKHYMELMHPDMDDCEESRDIFREQARNRVPNTYFECPIITKEGRKVWLGQNIQLVMKDSNVAGFQAVARDLTELKKMQAEILALSITDQLTGLYNRRGFLVLAKQQLKIADRDKTGMLLLFADLDGLKWINDIFGHEEGDKAILETASVLKQSLRSSEIIARLGGDEFAALIINSAEANTESITARLKFTIDALNRQKGRKYRLSISIGCASYDPGDPRSVDELIASADQLMYEQKKKKKELLPQGASLSSY